MQETYNAAKLAKILRVQGEKAVSPGSPSSWEADTVHRLRALEARRKLLAEAMRLLQDFTNFGRVMYDGQTHHAT